MEAGSGSREGIRSAAALGDLHGKKVGLIWTVFTNGNILLEALGELLAKRYRGLECVVLPPGKTARWGDPPERSLTELVREKGIDAAIVAAGC